MRTIVMLAISFSLIPVFSQTGSTKQEIRKEAGINLFPVFFSNNYRSDGFSFSATFRKWVNPQIAFRLSSELYVYRRNGFPFEILENIQPADSITVMMIEHDWKSPYPRISSGMEWHITDGKTNWFAGVEIYSGISKSNYSRDSLRGVRTYVNGKSEWLYEYIYTSERNERSLHTGIHTFFGVQFSFSDKWSLATQCGFDTDFAFTKGKKIENGVEAGQYDVIYFTMPLFAVITRLNLFYRF